MMPRLRIFDVPTYLLMYCLLLETLDSNAAQILYIASFDDCPRCSRTL